MPITKVRTPSGEIVQVQHPEGASDEQIIAYAKANAAAEQPKPSVASTAARFAMTPGRDLLAGFLRGAGSIGATLLAPHDLMNEAAFKAAGANVPAPDRRGAMDAALANMGADTESVGYGLGKLGGEIAGTAGVGPALAGGARAAGLSPQVIEALATAGMRTGAAQTTLLGKAADLGLRSAAGGTVGAASAGLVNPNDATTGGEFGAALPGALKAAGAVGRGVGALGRAVVPKATPEVAALAQKAKALGIDIPVDRLLDSRPVNAAAASLNYVPFSGRAATEDKLYRQFNRAVAKTIGENTDNLAQAVKNADARLNAEFKRVLSSNNVRIDPTFGNDAAAVVNKAVTELGDDAKPVAHMLDKILQMGSSGQLEGQAAYNIKRDLDRLGKGQSPAAYHFRQLRDALMEALNRSLGPQEAAAFAKTRRQFGNMSELESMIPMGAEGGISIGRIASAQSRKLRDPELRDLADIAGQFIKTRESPHGAAQRVTLGGLGSVLGMTTGQWIPLAGGMAAGRATNAALNSNKLKSLVLNQQTQPNALQALLSDPATAQLLYRAGPVLAADQ